MNLRAYSAEKDFSIIKDWITDEKTHVLWCANKTSFPIQKESFDRMLADLSEGFGDNPFVAVDEKGEPTGFFCYSLNNETKEGMLKFVMVDPERRGKGLGKELIRAAADYAFDETGATAVQLMVFSVNERVRHCYESVGFKERRTETGAFSYNDEVWDRCNMVLRNTKPRG